MQEQPVWIARDGITHGPYGERQLRDWLESGVVVAGDLAWREGAGGWMPLAQLTAPPPAGTATTLPPSPPMAAAPAASVRDDDFVRRIAEYERLSGILWIVFGVLQCVSVVAIVAGLWNIYAGTTRIRLAPAIRTREPWVPKAFEGYSQLVIIGVLNVVLGGVVGLVFVAFDFYIRDQVLSRRHLFEASASDADGPLHALVPPAAATRSGA